MRNPMWALQAAIKARLDAQTTTKTYDGIPQDAKFPYQTIGEFDSADWRTKTTDGMAVTHQIYAFSDFSGTKVLQDILDAQIQALDGFKPDLSADGFNVAHVRFATAKIKRHPDESGLRYSLLELTYLIEDLI